MTEIRTLNGMTLRNATTFITYLNSTFETFVSTTADLYEPCIVYFDDRWNIDSWSPYTIDELDEDHIKCYEFNSVYDAYEFIRHEHMREKNNRRYGIFSFNNEAIVRIERPNRPFRISRYNDIDVTKTTLFRKPKEGESRYMPVYAF